MEKIMEFASKCLNCKNKPCLKSCPMKTDIPGFIQKMKENDLQGAYNILVQNNLFTYICSKICPQEEQCQLTCTRGIKNDPVKIGFLEEYVNKWAEDNNIEYIPEVEKKNGYKIAVIGSGPAGLSCAYELCEKGYDVTVFEKDEKLGGILRYGVPDFRMSKHILDNIISKLFKMGIKFKTSFQLGKNLSLSEIKKDFNAVFLGLGAQSQVTYSLGSAKGNVYDSEKFLRMYNEKKYIKNLR